MADTPWISISDKLYVQSGQFTSTIKTSQSVSGVDTGAQGICYDGTDTPWVGITDDKLYIQSGQFTSTVKDSESVSTVSPYGVSIDGSNVPWTGDNDKLVLQSGKVTSTIKSSQSVSRVDSAPVGISWDGTNTPWVGQGDFKAYLTSGQFSTTIKTSTAALWTFTDPMPEAISWDGTNTPYAGSDSSKLILLSGQFSTTTKASFTVSDWPPFGISTTDYSSRVGAAAGISVPVVMQHLRQQGIA